jgi:hypothetical protein
MFRPDPIKTKFFPLKHDKTKVREPMGIIASNFYKEMRFPWLMISIYKRSWCALIDQKREKKGKWNLVKERHEIHRLEETRRETGERRWVQNRPYSNKVRVRGPETRITSVNSMIRPFGPVRLGTTRNCIHNSLRNQGLLIVEAPRSHSDTPHSVGFLWTSDQSDAETSIWQHATRTTDRHPCPRRCSNPAIPASERPQIHPSYRTPLETESG